jgi:effector-binding domain-containing protein
MTTIIPILSAVLALAVPIALDPGAQEDAAVLLAAQRAGLGDPVALARLGALRSYGTMEFVGFPMKGSFTSLLGAGGEARLESLFEGVPPSLRCRQGGLFWMTGTGGLELKKGWAAAADVRTFALARHGDWRDVYARAELAGEAEIAGRPCFELRMFPKTPAELGLEVVPGEEAREPDTWWLERGSKELVRVAIDATVSGAGWQRLVHDYSDWRPVAGVRFPHAGRMTFGPPEHPLVIVFETEGVEVGLTLAHTVFEPDEQVLAALASERSGGARREPGFALQTRKPLLTATVRVRCKPEEIQQQLGTILPEVMGYLTREGFHPAGPPFARYHASGVEMDIEAGIPVTEEIARNARVKPSSLPGGEVVSGTHYGAYHELTRTHEALARWLAGEELVADGGPWEIYWTDPGLERDPAKWRTEIVQPVKR